MKKSYKIITFILALAILPAAFFAPFVKIVVVSSAASLFSGSEVILDKSYSINDLVKTAQGGEDKEPLDIKALITGMSDKAKEKLGANFIAFLVLFLLSLITAIVLAVMAFVCKNKKRILLVSILGLAFTFGMNLMFNRFADPLISGLVPVTDLLSTEALSHFVGGGLAAIGGLLGGLLGGGASKLIDIRLLTLSGAYIVMLVLYIASTLWSLAYTLVEWE